MTLFGNWVFKEVIKVKWSFPQWLSGKESSAMDQMQETWVWSLSGEDPPGEGHGNPLQYSCLENLHGQRSLVGYSPWSRMHQLIKVGPNAVTGILMRKGNLDTGKLMAQRVKNPPAMQEI